MTYQVQDAATLEKGLARIVIRCDGASDPRVTGAVLRAVTDTVACMVAGSGEEATAAVCAAVGSWASASGCSVVGRPVRLPAPFAALVNGTAAHALDYDDVLEVAACHPSAVLVPAVLALAEERGSRGADAVGAYVAGFEVLARLGEVMNPVHYARGWHATSSLGALGAAAACARLLRLDEARVVAAVSLATSMAAGLKRQFGTMGKPLHAGLAAQAGVMAACMAEAGVTAAGDALTGERGFVECYAEPRSVLEEASAASAVLRHGIWTKAFPSCASTHRAVDAALDVRRTEGVRAEEVEAITVAISKLASQSLPFAVPEDGLQAKFSLPYCLASALVDGSLRLSSFTAGAVQRPEVRALLARVRVDTYDGPAAPGEPEPAFLELRTADGRRVSREVVHAPGSPARPLSAVVLKDKFWECVADRLGEGPAGEAFSLCQRLNELPRVDDLMVRLTNTTERP